MTTQDFFECDIKFLGFYDTVHSYAIDSYYECLYDSEDIYYTESQEYQNINFSETYKKYSEELFNGVFLPYLNDVINDLLISKKNYDFSKFISFKTLYQPKYYNFDNDKIVINFNKKLMSIVWNNINKKDFNEWLLNNHYSYSGFISFFSNGLQNEKWQVAIESWADYQESVVVEYLLKDFNRDIESDFYSEICIDSCLVFNDSKGV